MTHRILHRCCIPLLLILCLGVTASSGTKNKKAKDKKAAASEGSGKDAASAKDDHSAGKKKLAVQ